MKSKNHVINCDKPPSMFKSHWEVVVHQQHGLLEWNADDIELYNFAPGKTIFPGRNKLSQRSLNAAVLEHLYAHQDLIPQSWKCGKIFFWGTIMLDTHWGGEHVAYLEYSSGKWIIETCSIWRYRFKDNDYAPVYKQGKPKEEKLGTN